MSSPHADDPTATCHCVRRFLLLHNQAGPVSCVAVLDDIMPYVTPLHPSWGLALLYACKHTLIAIGSESGGRAV